jgi:hypothetical protein
LQVAETGSALTPGSLPEFIDKRRGSPMQIIALMLSTIIIHPSHQIFGAFSLGHVVGLGL